jgi:hypothetical protein
MDDITLTQIWKTQQQQLEQTQQFNLFMMDHLKQVKTESQLSSVTRFKSWAVALGILWLAFLALLVYGNHGQNWYFTISVSAIFLFNLLAVVTYIRHIVLIKGLDYSGTITTTQEKLAALELSTINITRILWLQMPFYCTFFWNHQLVTGDTRFQAIAFPITLFFTGLALWLYWNISPRNMDKKWLKALMNTGPEYRNVVKAREFLQELKNFKK